MSYIERTGETGDGSTQGAGGRSSNSEGGVSEGEQKATHVFAKKLPLAPADQTFLLRGGRSAPGPSILWVSRKGLEAIREISAILRQLSLQTAGLTLRHSPGWDNPLQRPALARKVEVGSLCRLTCWGLGGPPGMGPSVLSTCFQTGSCDKEAPDCRLWVLPVFFGEWPGGHFRLSHPLTSTLFCGQLLVRKLHEQGSAQGLS